MKGEILSIKTINEIKELNKQVKVLENENQDLKEEFAKLWDECNKLKELCDKYEEEHRTTFEYWKHLIKEDYKTRIDKAIELLYKRKHVENLFGGVEESNTDKIINILKGDNK